MSSLSTLSSHRRAVLQALFVTFLWSTSWVLIKIGLEDIPPLIFAGLRYLLAFLILLPFSLRGRYRGAWRSISPGLWGRLLLLGLVFYTLTQGGQFLTLKHLEAVTFSLLLNFSAVFVALIGIVYLREIPALHQWGGMAVFVGGVLVYFYPVLIPIDQRLGLLLAAGTVLSNAVAAVVGREVNRAGELPALLVTVVSMGFGAVLMLVIGLLTEGLPPLSLQSWLIVGWLAAVNTAYAFTLWNVTLKTLSATESSIINNTMLAQIAVLAWVFLGEQISGRELAGLVLAMVGILIVQVRRRA